MIASAWALRCSFNWIGHSRASMCGASNSMVLHAFYFLICAFWGTCTIKNNWSEKALAPQSRLYASLMRHMCLVFIFMLQRDTNRSKQNGEERLSNRINPWAKENYPPTVFGKFRQHGRIYVRRLWFEKCRLQLCVRLIPTYPHFRIILHQHQDNPIQQRAKELYQRANAVLIPAGRRQQN